ncbi:LPS assembly lipoprotein LptE [Bartonella phoceensis]|uniref:LPS assembly lipoprotein LptE n=1 Tax=Bartonella phoceensis TaxID=270249 RepID=UPI001ABBE0AA|nr:LPS assembly lipoprotein LptE [Bartonella phoceensis]
MSCFKNFLFVTFTVLLTLLCGCKIEPLYHEMSEVTTIDSVSYRHSSEPKSLRLSEKLASIIIAEPSDRFGQMVRNHLLFLLYENGSQPNDPAYQLTLQTSLFIRNSVQIEVDLDRKREGRPSVGTVVGKVSYTLQDMKNTPVGSGMGTVSASFERLRQEYATMQAEEDAKKRVAEELAEQILLLLSRDLAKG